MAKYINADELLQKSENVYYQYDTQHSPLDSSVCRGISLVEQMIINQPAADVEPVRHGEWERAIGDTHSNGIVYYCTSCSKNIVIFNSNLMSTMKYSHPYVFELPPYCPNCGAKMNKTK